MSNPGRGPSGAKFYLQGRDDAADDFVVNDYDLAGLAQRIIGGLSVHEACMGAVVADLATDVHDGTKDQWCAANEDDIADQGLDEETAYEAWRQGYADRAAWELQGALDDELDAAADEITALERPLPKRGE